MGETDRYIEEVVRKGDEGSELLAALCAPTLKNSSHVDVLRQGMNGVAVLRIPEGYVVGVHSVGASPRARNMKNHAKSLVERLVAGSREAGLTPLAITDVVDASVGDKQTVETIGNSLVRAADRFRLPIVNGELAILGGRVNCVANISGTMLSLAKKGKYPLGEWEVGGREYVFFDPRGKAVFANSDGVGTKTDPHERAGSYHLAVDDFMAMILDDTIKLGARARVVSGVVETSGKIPFEKILGRAIRIGDNNNLLAALYRENMGNRLAGYKAGVPTYNLSGTVVSTIDEEELRNPPVPRAGDRILALQGPVSNPRSNGITAKREAMVRMFGNDWHETPIGREFLEF